MNASAGTGKTTSIVRHYLAFLLEKPEDFPRVLGITFTKKAALEMKHRILKECYELAFTNKLNQSNDLLTDLIAMNPNIKTLDLTQQAEKLYKRILHEHYAFAFQTIDSFFHRLVLVFSKDLSIPPDFFIEEDTDYFLELCIQELFELSNHDPQLKDFLEQFFKYQIQKSKSWNIEYMLLNYAKAILQDRFHSLANAIHLNNAIDSYREVMDTFVKPTIQDFEEKVIPLLEEIYSIIEPYKENKQVLNNQYNTNLFSKLNKFLPSFKLKDTKKEDWDGLFKYIDKKTIFKSDAYSDIEKEIIPKLEELASLVNAKWKDYKTASLMERYHYTTALLFYLNDIARQVKKKQNLLLMQDIGLAIHEFIQKDSPEYLFWKLGNKYRYYFLDEFQDTSTQQYENLKPLLDNVAADFNLKSLLLFVGDVKQSIYRWRGSNAMLLHQQVPIDFKNLGLVTQKLQKNYRSAPQILEFVDEIFHTLVEKISNSSDEGKKLYEKVFSVYQGMKHECAQNHLSGYVKIQRLKKAESNGKSSGEDSDNKEKDLLVNQTLQTILHLKECGYQEHQICVIVRRNEESRLIAQVLYSNGIPFTANASLVLAHSIPVQFLLEALKFLEKPNDVLAQLNLRHLYAYLKNQYSEILPMTFETMMEQLQNMAQASTFLSLYEKAEGVLQQIGMNQLWDVFISNFLHFIRDYETRPYRKDMDFFTWFERYASQQTVLSEHQNAIRIMTIHQAKGLEFDIVICPFLDREIKPDYDTTFWATAKHPAIKNLPFLINYQKELANSHFYEDYLRETQESFLENANLLYVAITRAKLQFYGFYKITKESKTSITDFTKIAHWLDELGFCNDDVYEKGTFQYATSTTKTESSVEKFPVPTVFMQADRVVFRTPTPEEWQAVLAS